MSESPSHNLKLCGLYEPVKLFERTSGASVWEVLDQEGRKYAAKVSRIKNRKSRREFIMELKIYMELTDGRLRYNMKSDGTTPHGFANLRYAGNHNGEYDVLVMDLLSADLSTLSDETLWKVEFKYHTYLTLARDMLFTIMALHQRGFIHRNIKPHNFRLTGGFNPCILDFSAATRYLDEETKQHYEQCQEPSFTGTLEYASLNAQARMSQSRRDDLISLGYSIIDMMKKGLPWGTKHTEGRSLTYKSCFIKSVKENLRLESLCEGLPIGVLHYMRVVTALSFEEMPDYFLLHTLLDSRSQEYLWATL